MHMNRSVQWVKIFSIDHKSEGPLNMCSGCMPVVQSAGAERDEGVQVTGRTAGRKGGEERGGGKGGGFV